MYPEAMISASRVLSLFSRVNVTALKDIPELNLATVTISPKKSGSTFKVPLWLALALEELGMARLEDASDIPWLVRAHWRESVQKGDNLSHLPPAFYALSAKLLNKMKGRPDYPKYEATLDDLISMRLRKIVNLAAKGTEDRAVLEAMSDEERVLYRLLSNAIKHWREAVRER